MCHLTHICVYLVENLFMLGVSHRSVNLGMDIHLCDIGPTIVYTTLDYTPVYVRSIPIYIHFFYTHTPRV